MKRRRLMLLVVGVIAFAVWFWAMHKTIPRVVIWRTIDGREHYSLHDWSTGTYAWAVAGTLCGAVMVAALVMFVVSLGKGSDESRHGFPIR